MKTLCLLESVSRADGGIFEAERSLQRELQLRQKVQVEVLGLEDRYTGEDLALWSPLNPKAVKLSGPEAFGYSPELMKAMDRKVDLLYAATLWKYPSWAALRWAEETKKPMMVAPHGSLDPWAISHSVWKKQVASMLYKNRQLRRANCLRALCQAEAEAFRNYGLTNPIAIVPNGVVVPELSAVDPKNERGEKGGKRRLLFLGRIHPKKGLVNLLVAWSRSKKRYEWQLVIAGWDQGGHEAELLCLCEELGLSFSNKSSMGQDFEADVFFNGPVYGKEKTQLLNAVDAFILPSLSEGLPMSVLEAWAHGLPVLMSPECNLPIGFNVGAAMSVRSTVDSIGAGLDELFQLDKGSLSTMGKLGRELVKEHFDWGGISSRMKEVYSWMIGGGESPSCVIVK
jgi:poly(glycerol-phosphate) alpha-glucosyltransferase